jgi:hypothetical protein
MEEKKIFIPHSGTLDLALVAMGHKITNVPLILKIWEIIFCF